MVKKNTGLLEIISACKEIVRVSKSYSYLWDDSTLWKNKDSDDDDNPSKDLYLAYGWIAQDDSFSIYIGRMGKNFLFGGRNFLYFGESGLNANETAERIKKDFCKIYGIDAAFLRKSFYSSLEKPLGRYLAKRSLEELTRRTK